MEALNVVLDSLGQAQRIICLGDIVGYGPDPDACIEKIKELNIATVAGNHDKAVTGELPTDGFNQNARGAVLWTKEVISAKNLDYLKRLPLVLEEDDFQMVHGSLVNPLEEYITNSGNAYPTFQMMTRQLLFVGHTHQPLRLSFKSKEIINPGGVGQPRDGDPRASYGEYDSKTRVFTLHRVAYNIEKVQAKMRTAKLPLPLIDRLSFGR